MNIIIPMTGYGSRFAAAGYKELKPFLDGKEKLCECADRLKQATRKYAKRQLTWFNKEKTLNRLNMEKGLNEKAVDEIVEYFGKVKKMF